MFLYIISYFILFLPLMLAVNTTNDTVSSDVTINNSSTKISNITQNIKKSNSPMKLITEGGTLVTEAVPSTLPKETHIDLLQLDTELNKTKKTAIVPRKGALLPEDDLLKLNNTIMEKPKVNITTNKVDSKPNNTFQITTAPVIAKKPTILRGDDLNKAEVKKIEEILAPIGRETKVVVTPNKHPGIVIPIVITILVVPAFAALSYMALKRGKEAWKNRHYKRMDFLLEGMYND